MNYNIKRAEIDLERVEEKRLELLKKYKDVFLVKVDSNFYLETGIVFSKDNENNKKKALDFLKRYNYRITEHLITISSE